MANRITVRTSTDRHGVRFQGARVHYCPKGLLGTVCESQAIRQAANRGIEWTFAVTRAPGDWPSLHGNIEARIDRHAD